jgi:hypothetical protein
MPKPSALIAEWHCVAQWLWWIRLCPGRLMISSRKIGAPV